MGTGAAMGWSCGTLGKLAWAVFGLAVGLHLCTFVPAVPITVLWVAPLFAGIFPLFAAMIVSLNSLRRRLLPPPVPSAGVFERWGQENRSTRELQRRLFRLIPTPVKVLCVA